MLVPTPLCVFVIFSSKNRRVLKLAKLDKNEHARDYGKLNAIKMTACTRGENEGHRQPSLIQQMRSIREIDDEYMGVPS